MDRNPQVASRQQIKTMLPIFVHQILHYLTHTAGLEARTLCHGGERQSRLVPLQVTSCLPTEHPLPVSVYLSVDRSVAAAIFRRMAGEEMGEDADQATAREVVDEMLNTVIGNCIDALAEAAIRLRVFPPFSMHHPLPSQPLSAAAAACPIETSAGQALFWLDKRQPGSLDWGPLEGPCFTALIADDSMIVRKVIRKAVTAAGGEVVAEAADGLEAVQAYRRHRPDLVLLDITMPRQDGMRSARQILGEWPDATIVLATSINRSTTIAEARGMGVHHYLLKPFTDEVLRRTIADAIGLSSRCIGDCHEDPVRHR